jgi:hypothetical protein
MTYAARRERRHRIAEALRDGGEPRDIAGRFGVSTSTVVRIRTDEGIVGAEPKPIVAVPYEPDAPALSNDPLALGYDAAKAGARRMPPMRWRDEQRELWLAGYDEFSADSAAVAAR